MSTQSDYSAVETDGGAGTPSGRALPPAPSGPSPDWRARVRGSRIGTVLVLAVTLALVLLGSWLVTRSMGGDTPTAESSAGGATAVDVSSGAGPAPEVGKAAPEITATTIDGRKISLSGLKGRPVWVTFGATWCAPCRAEAPDIQAAYLAGKAAKLAVVGVYLSQSAADVRDYTTRLGMTYDHVADPDTRIAGAYRVMGIPTHVFIDKAGVVRHIQVGILTPEVMRERIVEISR